MSHPMWLLGTASIGKGQLIEDLVPDQCKLQLRGEIKNLRIQKSDLYKTGLIHYLNPADVKNKKKIVKKEGMKGSCRGGWGMRSKNIMAKPGLFHFPITLRVSGRFSLAEHVLALIN